MIRTFDVECAWKRDAITTPASTVGGKPIGLDSTGGLIGKGEVVAATNETGLCSASILGREVWVLVGWNET